MAILLDLRGQCAAAGGRVVRIDGDDRPLAHRLGQPRQFHHGVVLRILRCEQLTVLDEDQRVDHQGRDGVEVGVDAPRVVPVEQRRRAAIEHLQPGLRLLPVGSVEPMLRVVEQGLRMTGLGADLVTLRAQPLDVAGNSRVAEPLVERA